MLSTEVPVDNSSHLWHSKIMQYLLSFKPLLGLLSICHSFSLLVLHAVQGCWKLHCCPRHLLRSLVLKGNLPDVPQDFCCYIQYDAIMLTSLLPYSLKVTTQSLGIGLSLELSIQCCFYATGLFPPMFIL